MPPLRLISSTAMSMLRWMFCPESAIAPESGMATPISTGSAACDAVAPNVRPAASASPLIKCL
jgi:hypothetical protein